MFKALNFAARTIHYPAELLFDIILFLYILDGMSKNIIQELAEFGQSVWLDYISRSLIDTGKLKGLIDKGLRGMTSNPTIFDKAVSSSNDYDNKIQNLKKINKSTFAIYDELTVQDIQDAADTFKQVFESTNGLDGYVSLEINPKLAYDIEKTIEEGKRLYKKVDRPNVMFKVPSTNQGFSAITSLLAEGININITLIFSLSQYVKTADAYMKGIEQLAAKGGDVSSVRSVASVFVSRVDTLTDKIIEQKLTQNTDEALKEKLENLRGKAAVANAAFIFSKYRASFFGEKFKQLKNRGANVQRLLWGSTSTKNPAYSDTKYVTELIGKDTVNTIPEKTLNAFIDHGVIEEALTVNIDAPQKIIDELMDCGINIDDVCKKLLDNGVIAFEKSFDSLLNSIEEKTRKL
jgi:transaldolase